MLSQLLPRYLISHRFGIPHNELALERTDKGRPYAVSTLLSDESMSPHSNPSHQIHPLLPSTFDYNISHSGKWVVMAHTECGGKVGVDVMESKIPWEGETLEDYVEGLKDQVSLA